MNSILPDITAKHIATPVLDHQPVLLDLPLSMQLLTAAQWSLTPGREADALALVEHVVQTWHIEHDEIGCVTWH
jgi:hypothetical protein